MIQEKHGTDDYGDEIRDERKTRERPRGSMPPYHTNTADTNPTTHTTHNNPPPNTDHHITDTTLPRAPVKLPAGKAYTTNR